LQKELKRVLFRRKTNLQYAHELLDQPTKDWDHFIHVGFKDVEVVR
jgi:hypothetical protein